MEFRVRQAGDLRRAPAPTKATEAELFHTIFPHPTLSETMKEAVLDAYGRVLNM